MYSLEKCTEIWESAGKHGSKAERIARGKAWHPYYGYLAQKQLGKPYAPNPQNEEIVEYMFREEILRPEDSVLDIGCGMGDYALSMARRCARVVAMDNSSECTEVLKAKALSANLGNIEPCTLSWEEYAPEEKFDVTFSSMCPAICNLEELERMESITKRQCCLIAVTRGSFDKHRMRMMKELQLKPKGGMTTEAIHYINVLYLLGRQPNVRCFTRFSQRKVKAEDFREQYVHYFPIFGMDPEKAEEYIDRYIAENAVNGMIEDESLHNLAVISWAVPK